MRVLLVEDHVATREQVKALIGQEKDLVIVAEVGSGEEAIKSFKVMDPDVVVMDIMLPGMTGIAATRRIIAERPRARILALSNYSGPALVQAVLDAGGLGYVRKNRALEELVAAIRTVGAGQQFIGDNAQ